jgi:hypothetical protein
MNGVNEAEATELASRPCPPLPPENSMTQLKSRKRERT